MRTTVDIPDATYRELKALAASEGATIKQLLLRGAESVLRNRPQARVKRLDEPILNVGEPGSLYIDSEMIYDLIGFP